MLFALAALLMAQPAPVPSPARSVAIVGATLIDGTGAPPVRDAVVVLRGERIAAAGPADRVAIPPGAEQVDGRGRWVIPGLIDMHTHLDEVITPGAFPLFGITTVRDVGSRLVTIQRLRARAAKGEAIPRIYWMGRNIDEGKPSWWGAVAVKDAKGVPALLDDMARQGVDGVKLYVDAGPDVTRAVIRDAHRRGWPVTAHLAHTRPSDAARWGIDNLEHVATLFFELRPHNPRPPQGFAAMFAGVDQVDPRGPAARWLIRTLAQHHTAVTATLAADIMPVEGEAGAKRVYAGWTEIPEGWKRYWSSPYWSFISTRGWSARQFRAARQANVKYERMVGLLYRAGVPILAGTDTPAPWVLPGAGLVHELELLSRCGLPPMAVLRSATGQAARILRREGEVGTVRPGRRADLVLLDADPLADVRNLRRVHAVYQSGRPVDLGGLRQAFLAAKAP